MLKFTPILLGLVAATAIAQPSVAMNVPTATTPVVAQADSNLHAQLILNIGGNQRREIELRRARERARERERARARWESRHRHNSERKNYGYRR